MERILCWEHFLALFCYKKMMKNLSLVKNPKGKTELQQQKQRHNKGHLTLNNEDRYFCKQYIDYTATYD